MLAQWQLSDVPLLLPLPVLPPVPLLLLVPVAPLARVLAASSALIMPVSINR
jgi:hypothetical protein